MKKLFLLFAILCSYSSYAEDCIERLSKQNDKYFKFEGLDHKNEVKKILKECDVRFSIEDNSKYLEEVLYSAFITHDINLQRELIVSYSERIKEIRLQDKTYFRYKNDVDRDASIVHLAAKFSNVEILKVLFEHDFDLDAIAFHGTTPLILSVIFNNKGAVGFLLEKQVNVNNVDNDGNSALSYAVMQCDKALVQTLLEHGANKDVTADGADLLLEALSCADIIADSHSF